MEPHFVINVGGLEKLGFTEKEFLELFNIDFENAVQTCEKFNFGCPKCNRVSEDCFFIYHQYKDFRFGKNQNGEDVDYSFENIRYHLCICGCLYVFLSRNSRKTFEDEKEDEAKGSH